MWQTFETLWQALAVLNPRLRRRWLLLIPVAFLSAGMEMVATAGMLLLIRLISDPAIAGRSRIFITLSDVLRDRIPLPAGVPFIVPFAVILAVFYLIKNLLRLAETSVQQRCASDTSVWISCGLLERYLRAPYSLHLRRNSSEMLHMVNGAADNVGWEVLQPATALFSEAMIVIGILAVLTLQIPGSAFLTSAITGLVMILLLWSTQRSHTRWGRALHEGDIRLYQTLRQSLGSVKEAKILGRESYFVSRFAEVRSLVSRIHAIRSTLSMAPRLVVETIFVATLAIVVVAAWLRPQGGAGLVATLGIFAFGGLRLLPSLHLIVFRFNQIGAGVAALDTLSCDWESLKAGVSAPSISAGRPFAGSIQFQSVSFAYESSADESIRDVNLAIHCGESVGIVGPTGAGKTTLIDLMLGLLEPTSGRITVDGWDIRSQLSAWQRQIGYVPQSIYLIDDTIRRNIALGVEDAEIDESRVVESAHAAQLQEFLKSLPGGLGTVVGERGVKLSGGERQRIAVARALYRRPAILVFDEATAALDNSTEKALTSTIQKLTGNTTMIFIAHRLTTVKWCDRIVFMRQGQILDVGPYEELIERNADFRHLASAMAPTAH
jgi:ABC-type multidrug transport system fused ATPase/permease subunit